MLCETEYVRHLAEIDKSLKGKKVFFFYNDGDEDAKRKELENQGWKFYRKDISITIMIKESEV